MHDLTRAGSAIAGHPAAKVLDAEALHPTSKTSYFDILTVRISEQFFFCMGLERWWRWPTAKTKG
nr:MAG TPA: hypothetical protein [Caudoviricetes sp.]